jgi:hypothetical protein
MSRDGLRPFLLANRLVPAGPEFRCVGISEQRLGYQAMVFLQGRISELSGASHGDSPLAAPVSPSYPCGERSCPRNQAGGFETLPYRGSRSAALDSYAKPFDGF